MANVTLGRNFDDQDYFEFAVCDDRLVMALPSVALAQAAPADEARGE